MHRPSPHKVQLHNPPLCVAGVPPGESSNLCRKANQVSLDRSPQQSISKECDSHRLTRFLSCKTELKKGGVTKASGTNGEGLIIESINEFDKHRRRLLPQTVEAKELLDRSI
jgi:hypothetical protein